MLYENFPKAEVVGATTSGEISAEGFVSNSIVLNAIQDNRTRFKGALIDDIDKFPTVYKQDVINAASKAGISLSSASSSKDSFAISLICGLSNAEEKVLAFLYSIIKDEDFKICGGTAGDDLKFKATYVSLNGKVSSVAAVILFVHTSCKFKIVKENIFKKSGKTVLLSSADAEAHVVKSIDGKSPRKRYAEVLGITEAKVPEAILDHPFGRAFGDSVFIASLQQFKPDGTLLTYARVLQGSTQEILEPKDVKSVAEETCAKVKSEIPAPKCVILFNCILRTIGFQQKNLRQTVNDVWKKNYPVYSGFSTYGEQFGHMNSNQTLVALVIGD